MISLSTTALKVLEERYLLRGEGGEVVETPEEMFRRVARAVASADEAYGDDPAVAEDAFYSVMAKLEFLPNSPTLMNAGTPINQLSACFVLPVEDSIDSIFSSLRDMAIIHKSGGGVGFSFSRLRPRGDIVASTMGVASGPVSFMRIFDVAVDVIKQGGRRRGANMGVLHVSHPDIFSFIDAKSREGPLRNFNLSVTVPDEFMDDRPVDLINPRNGEVVDSVESRVILKRIVEAAWRSGDPGILFEDRINRYNPTPQLGRIEATNPCVSGDTIVMTSGGPRTVAELEGRPFTALIRGSGYPCPSGFFRTGERDVYDLRTREGPGLRLTHDHRVLVMDGGLEWRAAGELERGDLLVMDDSAGEFPALATFRGLRGAGRQDVYDATVYGASAFTANGFIVHNCGEQPLLPHESCNLGSVNLSLMVGPSGINWEKLRRTVHVAVHFLDNVIDVNSYPLRPVEEMTLRTRKIGLGVMGFADMLIKLGIPYNSVAALEVAGRVMSFISSEARMASMELARERGSFPEFKGSIWDIQGFECMRNATLTTIAPTGSLSIIAGTSSGIEPLFAVSFTRNILGRSFHELHPLFKTMAGRLDKRSLEAIESRGSLRGVPGVPAGIRRLFVTAHEIDPVFHVKMQAAFQRYVDNAVSKTVNLPADSSPADVERVFRAAHELGCKGVTVYRYGSKVDEVLRFPEYAGSCRDMTCPN
ncbi:MULTISPECIES: ribonucleotide reductase N-terminal alpha domain-containing protein [Methanothermobacter]|jgi:ribonucleoside-diphosphate reductase alpha chain|uniref:Ribonucleoside-diphosphate reductase n=1 Tax=Methanothermobacter thermautotrophicus TaxID=145262 RepID=A0A7J4MVM8_METTF|nr:MULTISPECIES: ribonucleotide reductase N-terminal alpha domain-containing protein [unclassified Methanothermobacter]MDK2874816.1 ribonucleoside-diphosphate reductase alpha chain [Methanothermobacter sp.]HIH64779.1 ribonucleotide reductase [Methanothermobacter thermautotrophicus]MDN5373975.1 ribonucleoside-diphosphate reductase alpha chain [Methanothermobacter sp.]BAM69828.1 ribonucleotide reductase large subunit [Methanothermobacter sp. CaT2]BAZ98696.1 Vitamin B12-dependent ribonucleoside-d